MRKIHLKDIQREFNLVRQELFELGLLKDGNAFDQIELFQSPIPSLTGEMGFVYDAGLDFFDKILGYEEGVIYIPSYAPIDKWIPGGTLRDTIRHEFGHIWAWISPAFFRKKWFSEAFNGSYWNASPFGEKLYSLFSKYPQDFKKSPYANSHVSIYSLFSPAEDFCETFMYYLKYGFHRKRIGSNSIKDRKLKAIKEAISNWNN